MLGGFDVLRGIRLGKHLSHFTKVGPYFSRKLGVLEGSWGTQKLTEQKVNRDAKMSGLRIRQIITPRNFIFLIILALLNGFHNVYAFWRFVLS